MQSATSESVCVGFEYRSDVFGVKCKFATPDHSIFAIEAAVSGKKTAVSNVFENDRRHPFAADKTAAQS